MTINEGRDEMTELNIGALRKSLRMNQKEFWAKVGVTQSGGSRYENGRDMPQPVQILLKLVYVQGVNVRTVERGDFRVIEYLKNADRPLLTKLKRVALKMQPAVQAAVPA